MSEADSDESTHARETEPHPSDKRLDEQLRRLYEYVLDEPVPKRLLDALKRNRETDDGSSEEDDTG